MAKNGFELDSKGFIKIENDSSKVVEGVLKAIAEDARRLVPKDTMELHDSIEVNFNPGDLDGSVSVGTDHWAPTEYGSGPHIIRATGDSVLTNGDGEFYGKEVNHPGTPEQPFMRPALYKKRSIKDVL